MNSVISFGIKRLINGKIQGEFFSGRVSSCDGIDMNGPCCYSVKEAEKKNMNVCGKNTSDKNNRSSPYDRPGLERRTPFGKDIFGRKNPGTVSFFHSGSGHRCGGIELFNNHTIKNNSNISYHIMEHQFHDNMINIMYNGVTYEYKCQFNKNILENIANLIFYSDRQNIYFDTANVYKINSPS